jgi:membrane protease YdiL (CAAX protease family)
MLLKKYRVRTTLIISSIIFGFAHTFNVISLTLMGVNPIDILISVSFQVTYATILGFAFGYMYIKTKSLLPSIILHYLIDSAGRLFWNTYISNIILLGFFLIVFFALIPAILIGLFVKFVTESDRTQNFFNNK